MMESYKQTSGLTVSQTHDAKSSEKVHRQHTSGNIGYAVAYKTRYHGFDPQWGLI